MTADGFFRSGDIGVVDDRGYFKVVDRKKDMILVSGFNVYPNEVEDIVSGMPGVLECAVIGVADEKSGEAVKLVVVRSNPALSEADVRAFCESNLTATSGPRSSSSAASCRRPMSARSFAGSFAPPDPARREQGHSERARRRRFMAPRPEGMRAGPLLHWRSTHSSVQR
jgi:hypothetical protein